MRSWPAFLLFLIAFSPAARSQKLQLEFEPEWHGQPLALHRQLAVQVRGTNADPISFHRIDGLLSQLAVQRTDGSWIESKQWHALMSAEKQRWSALADGLPAEDLKAIRFRIGLDSETDASDPETWPADHPLHPDVCGLHWGWRSGYVFLAVEGHVNSREHAGFSYHLAGPATPMWIELPVRFSGARSTRIRLGLDLAQVLDSGALLAQGNSTHSRDGDALAVALKQRVRSAFRVRGVDADIYQPAPASLPAKALPSAAAARLLAAHGTPYRLSISERLPQVKLPADNPLTVEGVELGRHLFHETKLSRQDRQSCASCHDRARAFTDGRPFSLGEGGQVGRRNAMPLANLAWAREFFWDGRARSLRDQVLMPIQDAHEMNETLERAIGKLAADAAYPERFQAAFGSPAVTAERMALALEQFLLTLISHESKFDRAARKLATLTPQEQRGLQLFVTEHDPARGLRGADCFHCHGGNLFSNHQFMNNGLPERAGDQGRAEVTRSDSDRGKFKVPSLRNVALSAPYMHDGRFATLEEVIEHYDGPMHRSATLDPNLAKHPPAGLGLAREDKAALIAFLHTLTDEPFAAARPSDSALLKPITR